MLNKHFLQINRNTYIFSCCLLNKTHLAEGGGAGMSLSKQLPGKQKFANIKIVLLGH